MKISPSSVKVLANDSDIDNDKLAITILVTAPAHGTATLNNNGTPNNSGDDFLIYTPSADFNGSDNFSYTISDGTDTATANVTLQVLAVNDAPRFTIGANQTVSQTAGSQVLAGFVTNISAGPPDESAQTLTFFVSANSPAAFAAQPTISLDGTLRYAPKLTASGLTTISVRLQDNGGTERGGVDSSAVQTFTIRINASNHAPVAHDQSLSVGANTPLPVTLSASDADYNALTFRIVTAPAHGALSGTVPNLTYTPNANYSGADSFTFVANDGALDSNVATVTLQVLAPPAPPVASPQNLSTNEDMPLAITLSGSATNSIFRIVAQPQNGTLSGTAPNLIYTPGANFNGADAFTFQISSANGQSNVATIALQVLAVNDAPVTSGQSVRVDNATPLPITLSATDVDGGALSFTITTPPAHGSLSGNAPNLIYSATPGYRGSDSFAFSVSDGQASAQATVSIEVVGDAAVIAVDDAYNLNLGPPNQTQNAGVTLMSSGVFQIKAPGVLANDSFVAGKPIFASATSNPKNGRFQLCADGTLFYLPSTGHIGVDEFTYTISDGKTSATARVRLNVIDKRAPELAFDTPRDRATLSQFTAIAGRVRDRNAGLKSVTLLWQRFDGKFWNGSAWTASATELSLDVQGINWSYNGALPTNAPEGRYDLRVTATDKSGNIHRVTNRIIVSSAAELSPVHLSSATATQNAIMLHFTGALDANVASDVAHYSLATPNLALKIGAVSYRDNVVTLSGFTLNADAAITLQIEGLRDASGKTLKSGTIGLTAR